VRRRDASSAAVESRLVAACVRFEENDINSRSVRTTMTMMSIIPTYDDHFSILNDEEGGERKTVRGRKEKDSFREVKCNVR